MKRLANIVTNASDAGEESINYFGEVIEHSELLFRKKGEFDTGFLKSKTYKSSVVEVDRLEEFYVAKSSLAAGNKQATSERPRPMIQKTGDGVSNAKPHREEKLNSPSHLIMS